MEDIAINKVPWSTDADVSFLYKGDRILITKLRRNKKSEQWLFDVIWKTGAVYGVVLCGGVNLLPVPCPLPFLIGINAAAGKDDPTPDNLELYLLSTEVISEPST